MNLENKAKICIIVEGKSDLFFLRDLMFENFKDIELIKNYKDKVDKVKYKEESIVFEHINNFIYIVVCQNNENLNSKGGWSNIETEIYYAVTEDFTKYLIIFDSDNEGTDNFKIKTSKINEVMNKFDLTYETYFLPLNEVNKGNDLEDLILSCIQPNYKDFFTCWENFSDCLKSNFNESNLPNKKKQLYTFKDVFNINNDNYTNKDFWNLNTNENKELEPLVQFLENNLK